MADQPVHASEVLTIEEAGAVLGLSRTAAYRAVRLNKFPVDTFEVGGVKKVRRADLCAVLHLPADHRFVLVDPASATAA